MSVDRERSFSFRSWPRVTCSFVGFTLVVFKSNNVVDYGTLGEAESSGITTCCPSYLLSSTSFYQCEVYLRFYFYFPSN